MDAIEDGDVVSLSDLRKLYRRETTITSKKTARNRIEALTTDGPFINVGRARWRYMEETHDVDE